MKRTSVILPTINGMEPWKRTMDIVKEAHRRKMEVCVAVDDRTTDDTYLQVRPYADRLLLVKNDKSYCEEVMNELSDATSGDWTFWLCDDEYPSEGLWNVAQDVRKLPRFIYRPRIVAPVPDWSGHYKPDETLQPRLFPKDTIRWITGGMDILPLRALPEKDIQPVLWHFTLWSPRKWREDKAAYNDSEWMKSWDHHPFPPSSSRAYLYEDHPEEYRPLGDYERYR